jgi:phage minor structural protein
LCERFECWADFVIDHDEDGHITNKRVVFKEYVGQPNYVGFRAGINLQNVKRTIDSKQIVTKLIVNDNINEFAKNGFCSIGRAKTSPSGENYIYNFSYYIQKGFLP